MTGDRPELVVALRHRWWWLMLDGHKTRELRRRWASRRWRGQPVWIYLPGEGVAGRLDAGAALELDVEACASMDGTALAAAEVRRYAGRLRELTAIAIERPRALSRPVAPAEMRERGWPPPQSLRYALPAESAHYRALDPLQAGGARKKT